MTTNILLAKPDVKYPVKKQGLWGDVGIPLGLLYLGAYARENNDIEIAVKDYRLDHALGKIRNLEQDMNKYDIIGVGACTAEVPDALNILKEAKEMGKTTIMGGIYSTFNVHHVLNTGYVDYIVRGEGERGLSELLKSLEGKISLDKVNGISFKRNGQIIDNPNQALIENLDELPMPAYDLVPVQDYVKLTSASIYSARGCPMTCKFCTLNDMWRFRHRKRSPENIIKELEMLKSFGFDRVNFKDESITLDKRRAIELFNEIEKANLGLSYKAKSRVEHIDDRLTKQMVGAGLDTIHTGVESVSQNSLKSMGKEVDVDYIRKAFDIVLNNGANINPVYLFSWAGETEADLLRNARFIEEQGKRKGVISYISFITPHPNSRISNHEGLEILTDDLSRYNHKQPVAVPKSLGRDGLRLMVNQYHKIAENIGMQKYNPRIEPAYLKEILNKQENSLKGGLLVA
jgi:radical SAM superfamily enzyme YgiQ (UPF0313 family)